MLVLLLALDGGQLGGYPQDLVVGALLVAAADGLVLVRAAAVLGAGGGGEEEQRGGPQHPGSCRLRWSPATSSNQGLGPGLGKEWPINDGDTATTNHSCQRNFAVI